MQNKTSVKEELNSADRQLLNSIEYDHLKIDEKNQSIHVISKLYLRAEIIFHAAEKCFSAIIHDCRERNTILLDPLQLGIEYSLRSQFKYVQIQIETYFRQIMCPEEYERANTTSCDKNLPNQFIGYETTLLAISFDIKKLSRQICICQ